MSETQAVLVVALMTCVVVTLLGAASSLRDIASSLRRINERQESRERRERLLRHDAENKRDPWALG